MINRPELKKQAKASLKNNWGYAIAAIVIYGAITAALSSTGIGGLFVGIFTLGYVAFFMAIIRGNKAKIEDLFCGFTDNFADSFVAGILISKVHRNVKMLISMPATKLSAKLSVKPQNRSSILALLPLIMAIKNAT